MTYGIKMMIWAGLTFAFMNVFIKLTPGIPSSEIVFFRAIISLILSAVILKRKRMSFWGNNRKVLILRGLFGTMALVMFFYSLHKLPLAAAMVVHYLSPIFTAVIAHFYLREKLKWVQVLFFSISFAGILLMKQVDERLQWFPVLAGVGGALFSGAAYNCIRKLKFTENSNVIIFYFPFLAVPITLAIVLITGNWVWPSVKEYGYLVIIGVLTQIAQHFLTKAYQSEMANKVAAVSNLGVIYGLVLGYLIFNDVFNVWSILGMALVVIGVVLNLYFDKQKSPKI
ncbi:MAG: DMT family transporter [Flavobacteriales bacterium]|nr:DMT family transporter [Flavobacteriales bacterium]